MRITADTYGQPLRLDAAPDRGALAPAWTSYIRADPPADLATDDLALLERVCAELEQSGTVAALGVAESASVQRAIAKVILHLRANYADGAGGPWVSPAIQQLSTVASMLARSRIEARQSVAAVISPRDNSSPLSVGLQPPKANVIGASAPAPAALAAVNLARVWLGRVTRDIASEVGIDQWRADQYSDRMCACFVSGVLRAAGYTGVDPNVTVYVFGVRGANIEDALTSSGWREVPPEQARPGDVAIFALPGSTLGHVELVAEETTAGTLTLIGSNNRRSLSSPQVVSFDERRIADTQGLRVLRAPPPR